jgi:hypothetical protein
MKRSVRQNGDLTAALGLNATPRHEFPNGQIAAIRAFLAPKIRC